eukprot:CAMPEP_0117791484 /NCGR_PEP_ID=MMETSP0948-20121206/8883_1 /TAXON_ID=44440 /ORGANISM="Chattonella subsalsa, Strain CCMP2191" /LENGTH=593 /DNA_ID=CAMNT_0005621543 /DNA_START=147 /DNA_END=1928 /DNA_ORIENTATION=+
MAHGSRGDIQAYLALGRGLMERGYSLQFLITEDEVHFAKQVLSCSSNPGLTFPISNVGCPPEIVGAFISCKACLSEDPLFRDALSKGNFLLVQKALEDVTKRTCVEGFGGNPNYFRSMVTNAFDELEKFNPSFIFFNFLCHEYACLYSVKHMIPAIPIWLQLFRPSPLVSPFSLLESAVESAVGMGYNFIPKFVNLLSWKIITKEFERTTCSRMALVHQVLMENEDKIARKKDVRNSESFSHEFWKSLDLMSLYLRQASYLMYYDLHSFPTYLVTAVTKYLKWEQVFPCVLSVQNKKSVASQNGVQLCGALMLNDDDCKELARVGGGYFGNGANSLEAKSLSIFLKNCAEDRPVYLGWGSMIALSAEHMSALAIETLMLSQKKGIILKGWANLSEEKAVMYYSQGSRYDPARIKRIQSFCAQGNVLFLESACHKSLFPECSVCVHHGGSGTSHASFSAGVPTIITPVFADQYYYRDAVNRMEIGVGLHKFQKVSAQELAQAIVTCCTDGKIQSAAKDLSMKMSFENGVKNLINEFEEFYAGEFVDGTWEKKERRLRKSVLQQRVCEKNPFSLKLSALLGLGLILAVLACLLPR